MGALGSRCLARGRTAVGLHERFQTTFFKLIVSLSPQFSFSLSGSPTRKFEFAWHLSSYYGARFCYYFDFFNNSASRTAISSTCRQSGRTLFFVAYGIFLSTTMNSVLPFYDSTTSTFQALLPRAFYISGDVGREAR